MTLLEKIDKLTFAQVISIALIITLALAVPAVVLLTQQKTRIGSKAYQKPQLITVKENILPGPIPNLPPKIGRVFPWVGKVGDIVWIQGENFGNNPLKKRLTIAGVTLSDNDITSWRDTEIQAFIPQGAKQGGVVEVRVGQHPVAESLPIVLYDRNSKIKLLKRENLILAQNAAEIVKVKVWFGDEKTPTEEREIPITPLTDRETPLFNSEGKPILSVVLFDQAGQVLPYYVNPVEFGF